MSHHRAHVYNSLEEYLKDCADMNNPKSVRKWTARWNKHIEKHGNIPLVLKCSVCSGKERKDDIKYGSFSPKRPSKRIRDEGKEEE